jgi:hypothetical protein
LISLIAAQAQTAQQRNAIQHTARIVAAEEACPRVEADKAQLMMGLLAYGVNVEDWKVGGRWNSIFVTAYQEAARAYASTTDQEMRCVTALMLYGPDGVNVKGILRKK